MKILFVSSEGLPYSKTGGLADVVEALPRALQAAGHEVVVLLPRYHGNKMASTLVSSVSIALGDKMRFPAIGEGAPVKGVRYFFVDDPAYFDRAQLYGEKSGDYPDNAERFAEFSRAAIEFMKRVWLPDVIHCHDWQSALVPLLLRTQHANDPVVRSLPVVLTIHNLGYQGLFPQSAMRSIGLPDNLFTMDALEFYGKVNFLKGGLIFADLPDHGEPALRQGDSDFGIRMGTRGRDPQSRGPAGRNPERRGLRRVEPGSGHADCAELFGAQFGRQESLQEGSARGVSSAGGESGAPADRNCLAFRGSEGIRPDRARLPPI